MKYTDQVYGKTEITDPVILELISCPALQRLKDIDQAGYLPIWKISDHHINEYDHSRFAHSVGVYLLLRNYGAPLEEQIAGLIHDVSHSAFSHCIDYVLDVGSEKEHNHQDNFFDVYIRKTQIPEIIEKYGFDPDYIFNDKNFPLEEKELPDLCADRIDYSLRTATIFKVINEQDKKYILKNLIGERTNWLFKDLKSAKKYARLFFKLNKIYYAGLDSAVMFRTVGDWLKYALQKGYIEKDDLYTTDKIVTAKINKYLDKDEYLKLLWDRMNKKIKTTNNPKNYDAQVYCKSRIVDPLFSDKGVVKRVSEAEPSWKDTVQRELKPKRYFLKFEK